MRPYAILPLLILCLAVSGCGGQPSAPAPVELTKPAPPAEISDEAFTAWLLDFRVQAHQAGIREDVLNEAFEDITPLPDVLELDRKQPETTITLEQYLRKTVTPVRVEQGRALMLQYGDVLSEVAAQYDVQPQFIVALWGMESNYGENTGGFDVIPALATLAYEGRRNAFFRDELIKALEIAQEEGIDPLGMEGSWAGAMGQCQFMPSSFLKYAVDFDGDGKRDIWNNPSDVFASIANYLHAEGWHGGQGLGTHSEFRSNFNVLMKWNRSVYFVTAVGQLATQLGAMGEES